MHEEVGAREQRERVISSAWDAAWGAPRGARALCPLSPAPSHPAPLSRPPLSAPPSLPSRGVPSFACESACGGGGEGKGECDGMSACDVAVLTCAPVLCLSMRCVLRGGRVPVRSGAMWCVKLWRAWNARRRERWVLLVARVRRRPRARCSGGGRLSLASVRCTCVHACRAAAGLAARAQAAGRSSEVHRNVGK